MQAEQVKKVYDQHKLLTMDNPLYRDCVRQYGVFAVLRDLGAESTTRKKAASLLAGDLTTAGVFGERGDAAASAVVLAKEPGIIAGLEEATYLYRHFGAAVRPKVRDGDAVGKGTVVLEVRGKLNVLLAVERRGLEILRRMSGIATQTAELVKKVKESGSAAQFAATRKCPWELLDKKAVTLGGGLTHRLCLADAVLIKDNHLEQLRVLGSKEPVKEALDCAWAVRKHAKFIEIEVTTIEQAEKAALYFQELSKLAKPVPAVILLDNMTPEQLSTVVARLKSLGLRDKVLLEASGGITPDNIVGYARTGVDVLSLGSITHSARILDLSQEITITGRG